MKYFCFFAEPSTQFRPLWRLVFESWCQSYKTFYVRNLRIFVVSQSVCYWQAQLILIFGGKARSLPQSGATESCFSCVCFSFTHKRQTRLERAAKDKLSSLLRKFVNYRRKKFYNIGPGLKRRTQLRRDVRQRQLQLPLLKPSRGLYYKHIYTIISDDRK